MYFNIKKDRLDYYKHLDPLVDNRTFWKAIKPIFTYNLQNSQPINLLEKVEIINDEMTIA